MENKNWAVVFEDLKKTKVMDAMMPKIGSCDVLINVKATALCSQEQRMFLGVRKLCGFPCVGGHESAGIVEAVGSDVKDIKVGDRVAIGTAFYRVPEGNPNAREDGIYVEEYGSISKYMKTRDDNCIVIKDDKLPFEKACLIEPVTCVTQSVKKGDVDFGDYVLIIGGGIMGLLHVQLAKKRGATVIVSEIDEARCKKALGYGADLIVNPKTEDAAAKIMEFTKGEGCDVVFNTTPFASSWDLAQAVLADYGKIVAYSSQHPDDPIGVKMGNLHSHHKQIIGTVDGFGDFKAALRMIENGIVDLDGLVDSVYKYTDCQKAFERATTPGVYRVIITD